MAFKILNKKIMTNNYFKQQEKLIMSILNSKNYKKMA